MSGSAPAVGSWTKHWDPSSKQHFYYDASTGQTTWGRPIPPSKNTESLKREEEGTLLEGIFLQHAKETAQHHDVRPRRRKRGGSRDRKNNNKRIFTDDGQPQNETIEDDELRKDYISFAKEYYVTAPFRDTGGKQICVICQKRKASAVLFPCEHKCVCARCIEREGFGATRTASEREALCPVCCQQVVFVAPCKGGGKEAELYWRWVDEIKPPLPKGFQRNFHNAAILLQIQTEPDSHKTWDTPPEAACCCILS
ncbi:unnamed protein product [Ectocarpus sp. 12 AP-2014]